jgi:hypothetical protein
MGLLLKKQQNQNGKFTSISIDDHENSQEIVDKYFFLQLKALFL